MAIIRARVAPKRDTMLNWSEHADFIPYKGEIIIYTDYKIRYVAGEKIVLAGLKVGDGCTNVMELPFINDISGGGSSGGTATINDVLIEGDLTLEELGIQPAGDYPDRPMTDREVDELFGILDETMDIAQQIEASSYVQLTRNEEVDEVIDIDHDVTIDFAGYNMTTEFDQPIFIVREGGSLTITGEGSVTAYRIAETRDDGKIIIESGTFTARNVGFFAVGEGSKITMNGGKLTCVVGGFGALDGAEIEINGGKIVCEDSYCLFTNNSINRGGNRIVLNGGMLVGNVETEGYESVVVYIANDDVFVMNGGSLVSTNGCGVLMRAGNVTLNGGSVETRGSGSGGRVGDSRFIMDHSAVIYHETANYPAKEGMTLTITGGTYVGVEHSVNVLSNEVSQNVFITGGNFNPPYETE